MKKILETYKEANLFCLSEYYFESYISTDDYNKIMNVYEKETYDDLKFLFNRVKESNNFKKDYDFDILFKDIYDECLTKKKKFIADDVIKGKTKYKNDGCIYHMYHEINNIIFNRKKDYSKYKKYDISDTLLLSEYQVLKDNIADIKIKYNNYATIGPLFRIYYFYLNDSTKEWLLNKKDVLNFNDGLDDFALLKDNQLLYYTCTHEGIK